MAEVERSGYGLDVERMKGGMTPRLTWQIGCIVVLFIRPAFQFEVPLKHQRGAGQEGHWLQEWGSEERTQLQIEMREPFDILICLILFRIAF